MEIIGLRNIINHQYEKVNYGSIYAIVQRQIPDLIALLKPLVHDPPEVEELCRKAECSRRSALR